MISRRRFDSHVHSRFSPDGSDDLAAFAAQVEAGVVDGIGFAEHYDFLPECGAFNYLDESVYKEAIAVWCERGYRFFAGVEVDFVKGEAAAIHQKLAEHRFDFVIGSIHTLPSGGVSDRWIGHWQDDAVFEQMLVEYQAEFLASLNMPEFDVIGHPGVFQRYLTTDFFAGKPWKQRIMDLEAHLAEQAAASDKLIEVNCSGLFAPLGTTCATPFFLRHYRDKGGRRLSLGSDAHTAANLARGLGRGAAMLAELGFTEVWLPWDRSDPVPLGAFA